MLATSSGTGAQEALEGGDLPVTPGELQRGYVYMTLEDILEFYEEYALADIMTLVRVRTLLGEYHDMPNQKRRYRMLVYAHAPRAPLM